MMRGEKNWRDEGEEPMEISPEIKELAKCRTTAEFLEEDLAGSTHEAYHPRHPREPWRHPKKRGWTRKP